MLKEFGVRNFKGIIQANIELKPITILIGANGSGKSSIGQALLLLKQSVGSKNLVIDRELIKFGETEDIFFNRSPSIPIMFNLEGSRGKIQYQEDLKIRNEEIKIKSRFLVPPYGIIMVSKGKVDPQELHYSPEVRIGLSATQLFSQPFIISSSSARTDEQDILRNTIAEINSASKILAEDLDSLWYVPSIRGTLNPFEYLEDNIVENLLIPSYERLETRNAKWISTLAYKPDILDIVSSWSREIFGKPLKNKLAPGKLITLESIKSVDEKKREQNPNITIVNEGFGLNQLSFLLTQLALAPRESIVIIEEPEIHLHPRAQIRLMEVLIREAITRNKRLLITTHSEHIIYQALTSVGLKEIDSQDLALYHFQEKSKGCYGRKLTFDDRGQLKNGLPDFFEANIEQYKRYIDVLTGEQPREG